MSPITGFESCADIRLQGVNERVAAMIEVLPPRSYMRPDPSYLNTKAVPEPSLSQLKEYFAAREAPAVSITAFEFPFCSTYGQGTVLLRDGVMVRDSAIEFLAHDLAPDGSIKGDDNSLLVEGPEETLIPGRSLLLKRPWYRNFGHWLVDLMPLPTLLRDAGVVVDRVLIGDVDPRLADIMLRTLQDVMPKVEVSVVSDYRHVRLETLVYVMPVHVPPLFKHPAAIDATVKTARAVFERRYSSHFPTKIYLSRQGAASRRLRNDDALSRLLANEGFATIALEQMDFGQQIALCSHAEAVVGVKGAALTNLIFAKPGAKLLTITPSQFIDPFFWDLLTPRGVEYSEIFCTSNPMGPPSMQDFEVDIDAVSRYLSR